MGILDSILGFFGGIGSAVGVVLAQLFNLIVQVFVFLFNFLVLVAQYVVGVFKAVGGFFQHLWDHFFKGIFLKVFHGLQSLSSFLEAHLRPIIKFLQSVQKYIDRIYNMYVRPFILMIQHIRQFLSILRALHINIANKLDAVLGTIQRDVQGVFLTIRATLNATIDLLNLIADPSMLLRRPTLLLSYRRVFNAFIRQVTGLPPGFFFPSPRKSAPKGLGFLPLNFDPANPAHNPPASFYLGLDEGVPSLAGLDPTLPVPNEFVDGTPVMDNFNDDLWVDDGCIDPVNCLNQAARILFNG